MADEEKKPLTFKAGFAAGIVAAGLTAASVGPTVIENQYDTTKAKYEAKAHKDTLKTKVHAEQVLLAWDRIDQDTTGRRDTVGKRLATVPAYVERINHKWNPGDDFLTEAGKKYRVTFADDETDSVYFRTVYEPGDSCEVIIKTQFPHRGRFADTAGRE